MSAGTWPTRQSGTVTPPTGGAAACAYDAPGRITTKTTGASIDTHSYLGSTETAWQNERERGSGTDPGRGVVVGPGAIRRIVTTLIAHAGAVGRSTHRRAMAGASGRGRCPWPHRRGRPGRARPRSSGRRRVDGADVPSRGTRESAWIGPARRHGLKGAGGGLRFLVGRLGHVFALAGSWATRGKVRAPPVPAPGSPSPDAEMPP